MDINGKSKVDCVYEQEGRIIPWVTLIPSLTRRLFSIFPPPPGRGC